MAALLLLALCLAVGVPYGGLRSLAVSGVDSVWSGLIVGAFLPFSMFGAEIQVAAGVGDGGASFSLGHLPLLAAGVPVWATWVVMKWATVRIRREPAGLIALPVKIGLVVGLLATVAASLLGGDADGYGSGGSFFARISAGDAAVYPFMIVAMAGIVYLWRRRDVPLNARLGRAISASWTRYALGGATAFLVLSIFMGALIVVAGLLTADNGRERLDSLVSIPIVGLNLGVSGAVFAMGGSVAQGLDHVSLVHWGGFSNGLAFPGEGSAPAPLFVLLLLAPALVAWATYRRFEAEPPVDEQGVVKAAALSGAGFVLAAWVLALFGRVETASGTLDSTRSAVAVPSLRGAIGLGLLWAAAAAVAAAAYWAREHGLQWTMLQPQPQPAEPRPVAVARPEPFKPPAPSESFAPPDPPARRGPAPPPPALAAPSNAPVDAICGTCGAVAPPGTGFCTQCGGRLAAEN